MRKLSAPRGVLPEKVGILSIEVAALMSRAAGLWRALSPESLARLRGETIRLEGVRRLVSDDDEALLSLALAEMAAACRDLARAVSRLSTRCADPLLRRFHSLFAALVKNSNGEGGGGDPHGLRYGDGRKMDRKARKMQRLVAATAHLCHEQDVLAELQQVHKQQQQSKQKQMTTTSTRGRRAECARRVERQRQEVERLRAASLWARTFDYAVRLLARSLFTIVARIVQAFDLQPVSSSPSSFVSGGSLHLHSLVYPSDAPTKKTTTMLLRARSGKVTSTTTTGGGDARRFLMSRSKSMRQQLRWPAAAGKHLIGCVVTGSAGSPGRNAWVHAAADAAHLPLSFSYVSADDDDDDFSSGIVSFHSHATAGNARPPSTTMSVFDSSSSGSSNNALNDPPESSLGAAALALHYANLVMFIEKLAVSPLHICADERDALYGMLTATLRASLRARLLLVKQAKAFSDSDPVLAAQWADTVRRILTWLAPLAHNMVRWQAERSFEHRNCGVASTGSGGGDTVLLLQTLHFADRRKTEAAVTELLVGLDYMWRHETAELEAKAGSESAAGRRRRQLR